MMGDRKERNGDVMKTAFTSPKYEFYHNEPYNLILVEQNENGVIIRAAWDNFSDRRKAFFIKEIAAEGFIPDRYQWFSNFEENGYTGIRWVIDRSWLKVHPGPVQKARKFMFWMLLAGGFLWLLLMVGLALPKKHPARGAASSLRSSDFVQETPGRVYQKETSRELKVKS
jgi:hypothetical protein